MSAASVTETQSATPATASPSSSLLASAKQLESPEFFKLLKGLVAEAEKLAKSGSGKAAKTTSSLKGKTPPQLKKNLAWVQYTLKDAIENGWEAFTVSQSVKDKETGEKQVEEIDMPAAVQNADGAWVYDGSISEKSPLGRQIIQKEAMSLSKIRKDSKHASWDAFESTYVEEEVASVASTSTSSKSVVRKTAAEKLAEAEVKKAAKEAEKAAKKEEREKERAEKKAAKEAEKAAAKAEKEAMKAAAKAAKVAPTKAKAPVKPAAAPAKAVAKPSAKPAAPKVAAVAVPDDGMLHAWTWKGKKYLRNFAGETWLAKADGSMGAWCGVYDPTEDKIDDSVEEPVFEDEE
jgi:hypothetical protein